jgi:hypothetical protein
MFSNKDAVAPIKKPADFQEQTNDLVLGSVKFLLNHVITTGHLPETELAQHKLDAIAALEAEELAANEPKPAEAPTVTKVADAPKVPEPIDAHNLAVNKIK